MRDQSYFKKLCCTVIATIALSACGGGGDDAATTDTTTSTTGTGTPTTPSADGGLYGGTYTGNVSKDTLTASYEGPLSLTLNRDVTGSYAVTGTLNMTRSVAVGLPTSTSDMISGTVSSAGALTATGNINVVSVSGNVDAATGKITGTYVYKTGSSSTFTGNFTIGK